MFVEVAGAERFGKSVDNIIMDGAGKREVVNNVAHKEFGLGFFWA